MPIHSRLIGLPRSRREPVSKPTVAGFSIDRPPDPYVSGFILPCFVSSSEFLRPHSHPNPFGSGSTAWVSSLFATAPRAFTSHEAFQSSLRSVLRRSQPLDGLLRARLRGLISSRSRVQGSFLVQGFLSPRSNPSSSEGTAPLPLSAARSPTFRSMPTAVVLDFEAFLRTELRSSEFAMKLSRQPLPSSSSSPPGAPFSRR